MEQRFFFTGKEQDDATKLSAVLFDMDGLMIDSEKGGVQACRQAGEEMGLSADQAEAFAIACIGLQ